MTNIDSFLAGYKKFRKKYSGKPGSLLETLDNEGQNPDALFVACSDSRVDPALLLQCKPGDIFVVRNVANLVPPYGVDTHHHGTSAALEFGICYLEIPKIIVLGHSSCGGVTAHMTKDTPQDDFLSTWLEIMPDFKGRNDINACAKESLIQSGKNLQTFPWIKERIEAGVLGIHLWFFNIADGVLEVYDPTENIFTPLA